MTHRDMHAAMHREFGKIAARRLMPYLGAGEFTRTMRGNWRVNPATRTLTMHVEGQCDVLAHDPNVLAQRAVEGSPHVAE